MSPRVDPTDRWESVYRLAVQIGETSRSSVIRALAWHIQREAMEARFGKAIADETIGRMPPLIEVVDGRVR